MSSISETPFLCLQVCQKPINCFLFSLLPVFSDTCIASHAFFRISLSSYLALRKFLTKIVFFEFKKGKMKQVTLVVSGVGFIIILFYYFMAEVENEENRNKRNIIIDSNVESQINQPLPLIEMQHIPQCNCHRAFLLSSSFSSKQVPNK